MVSKSSALHLPSSFQARSQAKPQVASHRGPHTFPTRPLRSIDSPLTAQVRHQKKPSAALSLQINALYFRHSVIPVPYLNDHPFFVRIEPQPYRRHASSPLSIEPASNEHY